jgi:beta-glucosidase
VLVLGPNADNRISVLGNYNGNPSEITTVLDGIRKKLGPGVNVVYEKAINFTNDTLLSYTDAINNCQWKGQKGWLAEYFNNKDLEGNPVFTRMEAQVDHAWQEGEQVGNGLAAGNFSARYTSNFISDKTGTLVFELEADDGYRVIINGKEELNVWLRNRWGARTLELKVQKDSTYQLVLEYWQGEGKANVKIKTGNWVKTDYATLLQKASKADAIIFTGGISPQLEGEEMKVNFPGFNGGDRTTIQLPEIQTRFLQQLHATGKQVVFVMMTGSALAIPWESQHLPGILNAWYAGQSAGTAVADVLFGDYNPAGRLPVTFYASDSDLPDFSDYSMKNRTYRYFTGKPLYPFGYGLSYTSFKYSQLQLPAVVTKGRALKLKVLLTNTGNRDGEEVVQVYVSHKNQQGTAPLRALKGFKRLALKAGESRLVEFELKPEQLSLVNEQGKMDQPTGQLSIHVGGGQPEQNIQTTSNTIGKTILVAEALANK